MPKDTKSTPTLDNPLSPFPHSHFSPISLFRRFTFPLTLFTLLLVVGDLIIALASYRLAFFLRGLSTWGVFYSTGSPNAWREVAHPWFLLLAAQLLCLLFFRLYRSLVRPTLRQIAVPALTAALAQTVVVVVVGRLLLGGGAIHESVYPFVLVLNGLGLTAWRGITFQARRPVTGLGALVRLPLVAVRGALAWFRGLGSVLRGRARVMVSARPEEVDRLAELASLRTALEEVEENQAALRERSSELTKGQASPQVVARLRVEYDARALDLRERIAVLLMTMQAELLALECARAEVEIQLRGLGERAEELRLRLAVGEYNPETYRAREAERLELEEAAQARLATLDERLAGYQAALGSAELPQPPALVRTLGQARHWAASTLDPQQVVVYFRGNLANLFIMGFMILLIACAFLLIGKQEQTAEGVANVAYLLLVIGVGIRLWEMIRSPEPEAPNPGGDGARGQQGEEKGESWPTLLLFLLVPLLLAALILLALVLWSS